MNTPNLAYGDRHSISLLRREITALEALYGLARERICDLEAERDTYRELALEALGVLHTVTGERDRLRKLNAELRGIRRHAGSRPTHRERRAA